MCDTYKSNIQYNLYNHITEDINFQFHSVKHDSGPLRVGVCGGEMGGPKARDRRKLWQVVAGFLEWIVGLLGNEAMP